MSDSSSSVDESRSAPKMQLAITHLGVLVTSAAAIVLVLVTGERCLEQLRAGAWASSVWPLLLFGLAAPLIYGSFVYQLARLGALKRQARHRSGHRAALETTYDAAASALVILVPSYKESLRHLRQTLMSAGLQDYPNRRVVLLVDDPPYPSSQSDLRDLLAARRLVRELRALFGEQSARIQAALADCRERRSAGRIDVVEQARRLAALYEEVSLWYLKQAASHPIIDHTDRLFVKRILLEPGQDHLAHARALSRAADGQEAGLDERQVAGECRRLAALFEVELVSFERKRYVNLSHEPNKAMNLNSYLGLLGGSFRSVARADGIALQAASPSECDLHVPDARYVLVLDADSVLLPVYASTLVHVMEQPGNERIAVAQTPYSAVPGAPGLLERTAGATTDIQYFIHQGFTEYGATYWVGANAIVRKAALDDIRELVVEGGILQPRYIQDRTQIEDTESSIDLVERGWQLLNYPERLAYSATPPDFGALLIQRRRWANGGLLIFPKLLRYMLTAPGRLRRLGEGFLRTSYLLNLALGTLSIVFMLSYPFDDGILNLCLALSGVAYFALYAADLVRAGYRARDLLHVYALNMSLIPIHLGGVLKSLVQAWTGKKIPFARTPKTGDRTGVPMLYMVAEYALLLVCVVSCCLGIARGRWGQVAWGLFNACVFLHAIGSFMGHKTGMLAALAGSGEPPPETDTNRSQPAARPANGRVALPG